MAHLKTWGRPSYPAPAQHWNWTLLQLSAAPPSQAWLLWSPRADENVGLVALAEVLGVVLLGSAATSPANSAGPWIKERALRLPCETRTAARVWILFHASGSKRYLERASGRGQRQMVHPSVRMQLSKLCGG